MVRLKNLLEYSIIVLTLEQGNIQHQK